MSRYPDWVNAHKKKGTSVKKVGDSYYLYRTTSKRVEGKEYPQPVQKFIGTITKDGVVESKVRKISTEQVKVYEYGFSNVLTKLVPDKFLKDLREKDKREYLLLNIIKYYSPTSYLLRDRDILTAEELRISLCTQIKKLERMIGITMKELKILSGIYLVEAGEYDMISVVTEDAKKLLNKLEVEIDDIPG